MSYPSTFTSFNRPTPSDRLNNPSHSALHNTVSSAVGQLEAVVGTASSVIGTVIGDLRNPASDGGGHVQTPVKGGTGLTSYTKGDLLIATSPSVLTKLAVGTDNQILTANSSVAAGVQWGAPVIQTYSQGALDPGFVKTYFNTQLLFTLWTGSTSGALTTDFLNWNRSSTEVSVTAGAAMCIFGGTGTEYMALYPALVAVGGTNSYISWDTTKKIIMDWWAYTPATSTGDIKMGFSVDSNELIAVYNSTANVAFAGFAQSSTGQTYATIMKNGVGVTNTAITVTKAVWSNYRIEFNVGTSVLFYVNGVLLATLSGANLYTSTQILTLGFGRSNTATYYVSAPNVSLQMI